MPVFMCKPHKDRRHFLQIKAANPQIESLLLAFAGFIVD